MRNDNAFFLPIKTFLIFLFVITCSLVLMYTWLSVNNQVECDVADQIMLKGTLLGFERNGSFWDVRINNETFLFNVFDKSYMESMLGFDITLSCCYRSAPTFEVAHYDMCCAFISKVE